MGRRIGKYSKTITVCCEGKETEPRYLRDIEKLNDRCFVDIMPHRYTGPIEIARQMINHVKSLAVDKSIEYWCVFDHDNRNEAVKDAFRLIDESNKIKGRPNIKIAFCKPCFEFWVLLHFVEKSSDIKDLSQDGCHRMLKKYMKTYDHNKNAVVDINLMQPNYKKARCFAEGFKKTYGTDAPYEASKYAGVYELVDSILSA